jgi:hypothetical protein
LSREDVLGRLLAHLGRTSGSDARLYVNEGIVGMPVRDAKSLPPGCTGANTADWEDACLEGGCVQRLHQSGNVESLFQVGRVFDDQVRHGSQIRSLVCPMVAANRPNGTTSPRQP